MSNSTVKMQDTAEVADLKAQLEAMKAEQAKLLANLAAKRGSSISFKVSEKGAVSVYGMGKFPVTLYGEQWDRLLSEEVTSQLKEFLAENRAAGKLSVKQAKQPQPMTAAQPDPKLTYRTGDGQTSHKTV